MAFVLQDVINLLEESCSLDPLKKLKLENLVKVSAHYGTTPAVDATKSHILDLIENYCLDNDIIDEVEEKPSVENVEVLKLKLEFQHEERRLAHEEAVRARESAESEAERAFEAVEAKAQRARDAKKA